MSDSFIFPEWPAPKNIHAVQTTRLGGYSAEPFLSFNLGSHVNDAPENVEKNREKLRSELNLPSEPFWLEQIHGNICIPAATPSSPPKADASFTREADQVCAILTADCLPILVCSQEGQEIAGIHAGWRGILNGVITETLQQLQTPANRLMAWLGPTLSPENCELNAQIRLAFIQKNPDNKRAFYVQKPDRCFADLAELARMQLQQFGVQQIYGGNFCTYRDEALFFSHRRDQGKTGRMATLIWFER